MRSRMRLPVIFVLLASPLASAQNGAAPSAGASLVSAHTSPGPSTRLVARVNGAPLTDLDLLREMYTIFPYAKQHNGSIPKAMEADIRQGALKMIEFEELVYQEAKRRQMSVAPVRLAAAEKQLHQRFETEQQYQRYFQAEAGGSEQVLRAKIRRSLLIDDLLQAEVNGKSAVTSAEARSFYEQNPQRFRFPETYALQTITVLPPKPAQGAESNPPTPEQMKQMRARAESALQQAKATKNYEEFGLLAEKISDDDYRVMMGDHRAVKVADLPPAILAAVTKMQPGQISDLLQVDGAYTIVRLNAHNASRLQTFSEAQELLRSRLQRSKTDKLRHELDARLRRNAKIEEL